MCDLHEVVIDYISKVVSWEAVTLHDDEVVHGPRWRLVSAVHQVAEERFEVAAAAMCSEAHAMSLAARGPVLRLTGGDVRAMAVVAGHVLAGGHGQLLDLIQPLGAAEAAVGFVLAEEFLYMLPIDRQSLRLQEQ